MQLVSSTFSGQLTLKAVSAVLRERSQEGEFQFDLDRHRKTVFGIKAAR